MANGELVAFKGMVDGVRINIDGEAGIFEILKELETKIQSSKAFFGDGDCRISFGGRVFSSVDKGRLEELVKKLLPLCRVEFDTQKPRELPQTDWILAYKERGTSSEVQTPVPEEKGTQDDSAFVSVFRSNRARLYQGTVNRGMTLRSDGHLVLLGTVNKGASLIATGNIIVVGGLYGTAHAGCNGHNGSYIIAMDMRPEGLAFAKVAEEYVYPQEETEPDSEPEDKKKSFFDKFRKRQEDDLENTIEPEPESFPAVALLKDNKIEIDNFSIQDFTNTKNMV